MSQAEDVAERIGGGQCYRGGADDRGVKQEQSEYAPHDGTDVQAESPRDAKCVGEVAEVGGAGKGGCRRHQDRAGADYHHDRSERGVRLLVVEPTRSDSFVNHVRLLKEELPRRNGSANDRDDQQNGVGGETTLDARHNEAVQGRGRIWMAQKDEWQDQQAGEQEDEHRTLPAPEVPRHCDANEHERRRRDNYVRTQAEVGPREAHPDELGADGEEVQEKQVPNREPAPKAAEPFDDELCVSDPGDGAEPDHHLLVDYQDRY